MQTQRWKRVRDVKEHSHSWRTKLDLKTESNNIAEWRLRFLFCSLSTNTLGSAISLSLFSVTSCSPSIPLYFAVRTFNLHSSNLFTQRSFTLSLSLFLTYFQTNFDLVTKFPVFKFRYILKKKNFFFPRFTPWICITIVLTSDQKGEKTAVASNQLQIEEMWNKTQTNRSKNKINIDRLHVIWAQKAHWICKSRIYCCFFCGVCVCVQFKITWTHTVQIVYIVFMKMLLFLLYTCVLFCMAIVFGQTKHVSINVIATTLDLPVPETHA